MRPARQNSDTNCGNWNKEEPATTLLLSVPDNSDIPLLQTIGIQRFVLQEDRKPLTLRQPQRRIMRDGEEDTTVYTVVVNHEEQYSIWPKHKIIPQGWKEVGKEGLKPECLEYIDEVWTDMRPLSLRKRMEGKFK
jgi:MbtH protein